MRIFRIDFVPDKHCTPKYKPSMLQHVQHQHKSLEEFQEKKTNKNIHSDRRK